MKGMAATMGFEKLTNLTHKVENLLDKVRNDEMYINEELIDYLLEGMDLIKILIEDIKNAGEEATEVSVYVDKLVNLIEGKAEEKPDEENEQDFKLKVDDDEIKNIQSRMRETDFVYSIKVKLSEDCMLKNVRGYMVLKKAQDLGYIVKSKPTKNQIEDEEFGDEILILLVSKQDVETIEKEINDIIDIKKVESSIMDIKSDSSKSQNTNTNSSQKTKTNNGNSFDVAPTVRVDINKLDNLMNMVGELLINKTRLEGLDISLEIYQDIIQQLDRVTMELHHVVMQIRMVPIGGIFNRFPRMIRDLSKELDKEVELIIEGADTELDRSIIDELADPLVHLLRNAVDHGIEHPDNREKKGKNRKGNILLKAYQKGSEIMIEVEDDGSGIDPDIIAQKAIEKGLVSQEEVDNMEKNDILNYIFNPGFSTNEEISDVSGRGVGMDVAKNVVESLDGQIHIDSKKDMGTKFVISLPLTLAITQALMVMINGEVFAIPLSAISETLTINPREMKQVRGQDVIILRDLTIPIVEASRRLNLDIEYEDYKNKEEIPVVIVNTGKQMVGLIIDELLNQQEIVIKSLGKYLVNTQHISGATIVGDGDVALILDVRNIA